MKTAVQFRVRFYRDDDVALGPGKITLLEAIADTGSISAAGRKLGMSYRRAWVLVAEMNELMSEPVVHAAAGGSKGGGTALTEVGIAVVKHYRAIEESARKASARDIAALQKLIAT
jgi:molybdate transport system regulatory protein